MRRKLNIASTLLFACAILPVVSALLMIFSGSSEFTYEELLGMTIVQIRDFKWHIFDFMDNTRHYMVHSMARWISSSR